MQTLIRVGVALTVTLALSACSGSGGGSIFNNPIGSAQCQPGTSVTTSYPQSGSNSVPTTIGTIEIVTSGDNNPVAQNPSAWTIALQSSFNGNIMPVSGNLSVASDRNGPHPYPTDFYFNQSIPQLQAGMQYNVYLEQTDGGCTPVQIGQFST